MRRQVRIAFDRIRPIRPQCAGILEQLGCQFDGGGGTCGSFTNDGTDQRSGGTFGNVIAYCRENGRDLKNPLTRFHPEIAHPVDRGPYELSCAELAQSAAPQLLYTNLQAATTMLCALLAWLNGKLDYEEVYVDVLDAKMTPVARSTPNRSPRL